MKIKSYIFISIILIFCGNFAFSQNVPLFIQSRDGIIKRLAKDIKTCMPDNVEILIYKIHLMNGDEKMQNELNAEFKAKLMSLCRKYKFTLTFENDIVNKYKNNRDYDLSFLADQDENELIAFGKLLDLDAIMISTVTIIDGKTKKVWDGKTLKFVDKKPALFQGIFFNTDTKLPIFRFMYYFYF